MRSADSFAIHLPSVDNVSIPELALAGSFVAAAAGAPQPLRATFRTDDRRAGAGGTPSGRASVPTPVPGAGRRVSLSGISSSGRGGTDAAGGAEPHRPADDSGAGPAAAPRDEGPGSPSGGNRSARRYRFPSPLDYVVLAALFFLIQMGVVIGWQATQGGLPDLTPSEELDEWGRAAAQAEIGRFNFLTYLLSMGAMLAVTLLYRRLRRGNHRVGRYSVRGLNPVVILWGVVLMRLAGVVIEPLVEWLGPVPALYGRGLWMALAVIVAAPLLEEILCRGVLLEAARARSGVVYGLLSSSLFFALLHAHPALMVNAFVAGVILGYIYLVSSSLFSVVILHAFNNALALTALTLGFGDVSLRELLGGEALYWSVYGLSLVLFLGAGYAIWRKIGALRQAEKAAAAQ